MTDHAIVGPWAKEKLEALSRYLTFYTKVMKNQHWATTYYLDAFAGGGRAVVKSQSPAGNFGQISLLDDEIDEDQAELINGSPRIALDLQDPFQHYIFVDPAPKRAGELLALKKEYEGRRTIDVLQIDAAEAIGCVTNRLKSVRQFRGVAFLDPFGAKLAWKSILKLAESKHFEVIINFALSMAIQRMLPNDGAVTPENRIILDAYFGTDAWFEQVYLTRSAGLFGDIGLEKRSDYHLRLLEFYRRRLEAAFGHVSAAHLVTNRRGAPLYYLIWAGPNKKGFEGAHYILQMGEKLKAARRNTKPQPLKSSPTPPKIE